MKIIIFAGGSGRRLWPISRQKSPKQFEPILGSKSTLQLAVGRVIDLAGGENIYISTNARYQDLVREQLPDLPADNIIGEPTRRDLAAAVGLSMAHLVAHDEEALDEPVAILWGDNYMENVDNFRQILNSAETLLQNDEAKILFIGETPRFANDNLGWLGLGEKLGEIEGRPYYRFDELRYRPPLDKTREMFAQQTHVWNTGYFVTTPRFVLAQYEAHQPTFAQQLAEIQDSIGTDEYQETLNRVYPQLESLSFDDAILQYVNAADAAVIHGVLGWSDPGTLYAMKEALNPNLEENVTKGLVVTDDSKDCLVYNYEDDKVVAAIGLDGMIVVNTKDAVLVVHKDQIPLVKKIVNDFEGTDLEKFS